MKVWMEGQDDEPPGKERIQNRVLITECNGNDEIINDKLPSLYSSKNCNEFSNDDVDCKFYLCFIVTNARSLPPKIQSLIDYMNELDLAFAVGSYRNLDEE